MCEQGTWTQCLSVHRPAQLRLAVHQQRRLRARGGEAARRRRAGAMPVPPRDHERGLAHHGSSDLPGDGGAAKSARPPRPSTLLEARELLYDLVESVTGARLTVTWCRVGGVTHDLPADFGTASSSAFRQPRCGSQPTATSCSTRNRVFIDRMSRDRNTVARGRDLLRPYRSAAARHWRQLRRAQSRSVPGLRSLRLRGADRRARRQLRSLQRTLPGDVPVAADHRAGDGDDSRRAPSSIADPHRVLPPKQQVYNSIEGLMNHFKLIMEGIKVPAGRGLSRGRRRQRRARLLRRQRRQRPSVPRAGQAAVLPRDGRAQQDAHRPHDRRHHHHLRDDQHDRRRVRPLNGKNPPISRIESERF